MIGMLSGMLVGKEPGRLLIDVQGVGYEVEVPMSTYLSTPGVNHHLRLFIHHVVREDASLLFGFATEAERALFRALLKVNGVGPKMALAVLSAVSAEDFERAIAASDAAALTRIPGVGRKTAERLVIELRDYFDTRATKSLLGGVGSNPREEAAQALQTLGYKPIEVPRMLENLDLAAGASTEDWIRAALQAAALKQG
jgi:holliday junction DNA helicase RuvA